MNRHVIIIKTIIIIIIIIAIIIIIIIIIINVFLERNKFDLNICPPSIKFTQCQTVLRNSLKESPNDSLKDLWKSSSCHTNIQYDVYKST